MNQNDKKTGTAATSAQSQNDVRALIQEPENPSFAQNLITFLKILTGAAVLAGLIWLLDRTVA